MARGREKIREDSLLPYFRQGVLLCSACGTTVPLAGLQPLSMGQCANCDNREFVPLHLAGFWLFAPLGGGAMGSVYKAYHDDAGDKLFAVKILPRKDRVDPQLIEHLQKEAAACRAFGRHPCLVDFEDAGCVDGEHYLATEFILGRRLDKRIRREGRLPEHEVLALALRLLAAEAHIYRSGYLYRDLKPQNVIITEQGAVLCDYGISLPLELARGDQGDAVQGSVLYFPPERLTGEGESAASEIYALGMVMYHALTGHTYFTADEVNHVLERHVSDLRLGTSIRFGLRGGKMKGIAADLAAVISKMISRQPHRRYQHFAEAERDLLVLFRDRFVHAWPPR